MTVFSTITLENTVPERTIHTAIAQCAMGLDWSKIIPVHSQHEIVEQLLKPVAVGHSKLCAK
ncbi:hypothetical protein AGR8A_Cc30604 [Agrobacterium fabrum str. J-07]|nr:hypothetical protein AGR8A_Cc30604 [Agrobacterium fabrum str. J-07]